MPAPLHAWAPPENPVGSHEGSPGGLQDYPQGPASARRGAACDQLRFQLARLRCRADLEERSQREESEILLSRVVALRTEHRALHEEASRSAKEASAEEVAAERQELKTQSISQKLADELALAQDELSAARGWLNTVSTTTVLEDPEDTLKEVQLQCIELSERSQEYEESRSACLELSSRLGERIDPLQEEVAQARSIGRRLEADREALSKQTPEEAKRLRGEVKILAAKVQLHHSEVGEDIRALWLTAESELPRLRHQDAERRKLQQMLNQARWEKDRLQRDYDEVVRGLQEQKAVQIDNEKELRTSLLATRAEGEAMVAEMTESDKRLSEMRKDCWETETFVQHLTKQVERLEGERQRLRSTLSTRRPGAHRSDLADLGRAAQEASLAWLRQDHDRLVADLKEQVKRDEEEARIVGRSCAEMEVELVAVQEHNIELRSEAEVVAPLLASRGRR